MKKYLAQSAVFFSIYAGLLIVATFTLLSTDKGSTVLWLNSIHTPILDFFFKYFTFVADGITVVIVLLVSIFINRYFAFIASITGIVVSLFTQLLKRLVFSDFMRPVVMLGRDHHFVEGVQIHTDHSFPSGHTSAAFFLFFLIALQLRKPIAQIICVMTATLVAISRMYLFQHYLVDVVVGSLIGISVSILIKYLLENHFNIQNLTFLKYGQKN